MVASFFESFFSKVPEEPNVIPDDIPMKSPLTQLIDDIAMSVQPRSQRIALLEDACNAFNHRDQNMHDVELHEGAARVLFAKLSFVIAIHASDYELKTVCSALEMVHRGSEYGIEQTYNMIGFEVLPLLVKVMQIPFERGQKIKDVDGKANLTSEDALRPSSQNLVRGAAPDGARVLLSVTSDVKTAVQKATKILAAYSLIPAAKVKMAHVPKMLHALIAITDRRNAMNDAARFSALATITNMAHDENNRIAMASEQNLIDSISRMAKYEESDMARQCSALALMNLSQGDSASVPLIDENEILLDTLVRLMGDEKPDTRRNAAIALYNIACADDNTIRLAKHRDGVILEALVRIVASENDVDEARLNAAEALFNMACSEKEEVTKRMGDYPGFLYALANVLKTDSANTSTGVELYVAETLRRMAEVTNSNMAAHGALLGSLVDSSCWTETSCIAEAFEHQASSPDHREIMAKRPGLLSGLARQALAVGANGEKTRTAAIAAIELLTLVDSNRPILAANEGIMMALTRASFGEAAGDDEDAIRLAEERNKSVQLALKNLVQAI